MGIQQNYLYRVMPGLAEEGKVTKSGKGWHLREGAGLSAERAAPARHAHARDAQTSPSPSTASRSSWSSADGLGDPLAREVRHVEPLDDLPRRRPSSGTGTRR